LRNKAIFIKVILIFGLFFPALSFGYWKEHKTYTPYLFSPEGVVGTENKAGSDPLDPESKPVDTDGDGIPDATDPDDDNDEFTDVDENKAGSDPLDPESKPTDTDGDGIPDSKDEDDDNDGYADDTENKAGSDPLDPESKPNQEKLRLHTLIENEIRNEIRKLGCIYVYNKYFIEKKVPKSYPSGHDWNNWSRFDIKEFENLIWECKKDK
jgi:hypothetical protein